jgi:MATE family multidrug resistance protein
MVRIARLGWPIGMQLSAEVGIFALFGMLIARFGDVAIGGHQVALTWTALVFMCALGLGAGAATRVGIHVGGRRTEDARRAGYLAIGLGAAWMAFWAVLFVSFDESLSWVFAPGQGEVIAVAKDLLVIGAVFAISDGVQAVAAGALRGAGDTKWPFFANVGAHWLVAVPVAVWLAEFRGMGPAGYWWGLTLGLTLVAVVLVLRFVRVSSRPIAAA